MFVLYQFDENIPVLLQPSGALTRIEKFEIGAKTGAFRVCSVLLNGVMMVFGGVAKPIDNQISVIENCGLRRIGDLPMHFDWGGCNVYQTPEGTQETLLCFGRNTGIKMEGTKICHS